MDQTSVVCECCRLSNPERLSSPVVNAYALNRGWRCRMCNEHQGDPLKMAQDHESEIRARWEKTAARWRAAEAKANEYEEKMRAAYRSRDNVLRQFEKLSQHHRATEHGCTCRQPRCKTLAIVSADWINEQIARMHYREAM